MRQRSCCDRLTQAIRALAYWPADWRLWVRFGRPAAYHSLGHPAFRGLKKVGARSSWVRVLTLHVREDWEEAVLRPGLAVVEPEPGGGQVFVLEAVPHPAPGGADGCWWLSTAWCMCPERHSRVRSGGWWLVRFGGRDWFSEGSAERAMEKAARAVELGLGLRDEELPF